MAENVSEYGRGKPLPYPIGNYIMIPSDVILDTGANDKRVTAFSFFAMKRGVDGEVDFTLNDVVRWSGKKPNRHPNGINAIMAESIGHLRDEGYIALSGELGNTSRATAFFDPAASSRQRNSKCFATIYVDEVKKVLSYSNVNSKDSFFNNDILLLVFAYIRMMIYRRPNELRPGEADIEQRKVKFPDTYNAYYDDIAERLGITQRAVSKAVDALNELGIVYSESLPRLKQDNRWRTCHTIFANAYKRERGFLLAEGAGYYGPEIANRKAQLTFN